MSKRAAVIRDGVVVNVVVVPDREDEWPDFEADEVQVINEDDEDERQAVGIGSLVDGGRKGKRKFKRPERPEPVSPVVEMDPSAVVNVDLKTVAKVLMRKGLLTAEDLENTDGA